MVMIVSGVLFAAILNLYVVYAKRVKIELSYDRLFTANMLMTEAWNLDQRYYCPADPTLPPGDVNYGRENCANAVATGSCTGGTTGVCVGAGITNQLASNQVLIGMYPFTTIAEEYEDRRLAVQQAYEATIDPTMKASLKRTMEAIKKNRLSRAVDMAFDGWGNQFTYAVTRTHTIRNTNRFNDRIAGSLEVINAALNEDARRGVHFALISHGENGKAAYGRLGVRKLACDDPAVSPLEQENCDTDGTFLRPALISRARTADEADDIVVYNSYIAQDLWRIVACNTDGNPSTEEFCIHNTNPGNVGIGTEGGDISQKLTVDGPLRAERIVTQELCDANGANCFAPDYIGGDAFAPCSQSGLAPNQRRVAVQISNRTLRCETITLPGYNTGCSGRELVAGFDSGGLNCVDPCVEQTITNSTACPTGQTGQINYQVTFSCAVDPPAWGTWQETGRTCAP